MLRVASCLILLALAACSEGAAPSRSDVLETGAPGCELDAECAGEVCWKVVDYDPECGGTVCSLECEIDNECQVAAAVAGASQPERASCGSDGRCVLLETGLAAFLCIRPGPECLVPADCGYNTGTTAWTCTEDGSCAQGEAENLCTEDEDCAAEEFCYLDPTLNLEEGVCVPTRCQPDADCTLDNGAIIYIHAGT